MNNSNPEHAGKSPGSANPKEQKELDELRRLLFNKEQEELKNLRRSLDNPELLATKVSRALPRSIVIRSERDDELAKALNPMLEKSIKRSVTKNVRSFANILFPVMGPAIRKSITETFRNMLQSFNHAIGKSFSLQGLRWRLEASRTGKSFGEVVLLHTLLYKVEQVFLIHRENGLLLQHVMGETVVAQDGDMVSAMLTALQDFVHDSFGGKEASLDTLEVGDLTVWIQQGPHAILAAVVRGNAPRELRRTLEIAIEDIHLEKGEEMESFDGDTAPFETIRHYMEDCLVESDTKEEKKGNTRLAWAVICAILVALGIWSFFYVRSNRLWANYLAILKSEPGIVVTDAGRHFGKFYISGLRDPLAEDPVELMSQAKINPGRVRIHWELYQSLTPGFGAIAAYMERLKSEPGIVVTAVRKQGGKFHIAGLRDPLAADPMEMLDEANLGDQEVIGYWKPYQSFTSEFVLKRSYKILRPPATVSLKVENKTLYVSGLAEMQWVRDTQRLGRAIPGISHFDETNLAVAELENLKEKIEAETLLFSIGTTQLQAGYGVVRERLKTYARNLLELAERAERMVRIEITGHTDALSDRWGWERRKQAEQEDNGLSSGRAQWFLSELASIGISESNLSARGAGAEEPLRAGVSLKDRDFNRSVSFKVHISTISKEQDL